MARERIFQRHNPRAVRISLTSTLPIDKLEYADDVALLDENAEAAQEQFSLLSPAANSEGGLNVAAHERIVQHVQKAKRLPRTTEEDVEKMDLSFSALAAKKFPARKLPSNSPSTTLKASTIDFQAPVTMPPGGCQKSRFENGMISAGLSGIWALSLM